MTFFDGEVDTLVASLNASAGRDVASLIASGEAAYDQFMESFPTNTRDRVFEKEVHSSQGIDDEYWFDALPRCLKDFKVFCQISKFLSRQRITFISDKFYFNAMEVEMEFTETILREWLPKPHAIYMVGPSSYMHISYTRKTHVFIKV